MSEPSVFDSTGAESTVSESTVPASTVPESSVSPSTVSESTVSESGRAESNDAPPTGPPASAVDEDSLGAASDSPDSGANDATGGGVPRAASAPSASRTDLEREGEVAADYLEALLDIADLDGDIDMDVEGNRAMVAIEADGGLDALVGPNGRVLEALQELTRLAVLRETGERSRLMLDVAGYRAERRAELDTLGRATAADVQRTGQPVKLDPMTPFERKIVHDAVSAAGSASESEGEEPRRCVVVRPA